MMVKRIVAFLIALLYWNGMEAQIPVSDYKCFFAIAKDGEQEIIIIRKFLREGQSCYLAIDVNTLDTRIVNAATVIAKPSSWDEINSFFRNSPYMTAISRVKGQSFALQDAGIIHGYPKEKGITLTIDLCPSHKALDRVIFMSLVNDFKAIEKPVPIALSLSGRFLLTHGGDIEWLKGLERSGDIEITWINHTYNHHFDPRAPLKENFLLEPGTDLDFEILGTEVAMIQQGLTPSVFFRFPGLVSDNSIVDRVLKYGLIPVGSDAWLAKGQAARGGSIVLIHGNGNEPLGIKDFIALLHTNLEAIRKRQWLLYDLRESVRNEFSDK